MINNYDIGFRIMLMIDERKTTQTELAKKVGITRATLSRYVKGEHAIRCDILGEIAKALNVSSDWLIFGNKAEYNKQTIFPCTKEEIDALYNWRKKRND